MISEKAKIPIKTSNPAAALKQLEGKSFRVDRAHEDGFANHQSTVIKEIETVLARAQAVLAESPTPEDAQSSSIHPTDIQPDDRNRQLIAHLKAKERSLVEQDVNHQVRVWNWQQEVAKTQAAQDRRQADLNQQEQQLRALQFELLQLQNQLIDGQLATRELIGDLQIPGQQESALQSLKFELNQRFDHVMVTWREFAARFQLAVESVSRRQ